MERLTDIELIQLYRKGDKAAFDFLVHRHLDSIYYFSVRLVGAEEANDMAQETFIKVWKYLARFDAKKNFKVWLFRIARNTCLDHLRKRQPVLFSNLKNDEENDLSFEDALSYNGPSAEDILISKDLEAQMNTLLSTLPVPTQEVFTLYYREGMSFAEIAEALGLSVNTVKSRHFRGISELRKVIGKDAPKT